MILPETFTMPALTTPPTSAFIGLPMGNRMSSFRRFTVAEYHKLIDIGILTQDDNLELLDGHLVRKMSRNAPHDGTIQLVEAALNAVLPVGWRLRNRSAVTLPASEPEPDFAVARGTVRTYLTRHPVVADVGLVVGVADSTLDTDRDIKAPLYGHAGLPEYWIINIPDRRIEVYAQPTGLTATPGYMSRVEFVPGQSVPFSLDGQVVANLPVDDLLP